MKKKLFLMILVLLVNKATAQQFITGKVISMSDDLPIKGANIRSLLNGGSAITDSEGGFRLPIITDVDTLLVTYIGFIPKYVAVKASEDQLPIFLVSEDSTLDDVIINTGYYQIPKERATGSFTHIDKDMLNRGVGSNILQRLEGIVPGVQFINPNGASASDIRVRGIATIESDETPLIVLDNFPYEGNINSINPNDVESITVLKDAAAASIWGARAGNGVIVITTKQGRYNQKSTISFNSNFTIGEKADLFYNQSWLPAETVMSIEKELFERGGHYLESVQQRPFPAYVELLIKHKGGLISDNEFSRKESLMKSIDVRNEALNYLYQAEANQQYALNISGGSDIYSYYMSIGHDRSRGVLVGDGNNRFNLNFQNTFQPVKGLEISAGIWHTEHKADHNGLSLGSLNPASAQKVSTYVRLADEEGNALAIPHERRLEYYDKAESSGLLDWHYRPLDEIGLAKRNSKGEEYRFNVGLRYNFLADFNLNVTYLYQKINSSSETYYDPESYYVRNLVNRFTQDNGTRIIPHQGILDAGRNSLGYVQSARGQLNYQKLFGSGHRIVALGGGEIRENIAKISPGYRMYNHDKNILTGTSTYNYNQSYPVRPAGSTRLPGPDAGLGYYSDRYLSYFGNTSYTYQDRYILSSSIRWDGSNLFGVKTNQKGVPLWSVGGSWLASKESFYRLEGWMPYLRVRATYGSAGNVNKNVSVFPVVSYSTNGLTGLPEARLQSVGNPSLRWEQVNTLNFGLDFGTSNHRIQGSIEHYVKYAEDLIGKDFMPPSTGINDAVRLTNQVNYANLQTHGWDVQLISQNVIGKFKWKTDLQFSYVRDKVTNFNLADATSVGIYLSDPLPIVGHSRDMIYAFPWSGLDPASGMPLVNIEGKLTKEYSRYYQDYLISDLLTAGLKIPPYHGAVRNIFSWTNFKLDVNIIWKSGYVFRRRSISPGVEFQGTYHMDYFRRWEKIGDENYTNVPAFSETYDWQLSSVYENSEALITKGNHIRLKDINLKYTFQSKKMPFQNASLFIYAQNLGIIWRANKNGIDPDYQNTDYTAPRTFSFGVQFDL